MYRYSLVIILLMGFLFTGCVQKAQVPKKSIIKPYKDENRYLLFALMLSQNSDYNGALSYFEKLYKHTNRIEYLKYALSLSAKLKDYDAFYSLLSDGLKKYPNNQILKRELVRFYIYKKDPKKAKELTLELIKRYKTEENYKFAGTVFLNLKEYELSLKAFEKAYSFNYNEDILNNIADIMYLFLNKKDEAIAYLETHIRVRGCSKKICHKLLEIYAREKDVDGLMSTYKRLYSKTKESVYAKKLSGLMLYKGEKKEALKFLKKHDVDSKMLIDIYLSMKDFKGAYNETKKLYEKTKKIDYLGKMAIYEYEGSKIKDKKLLNSVAKKFEKVTKVLKDPLYLNYYGYLLIDHEIDIKRGIKLVKEALKKDPKSPYYLDSLAWGYYKIGRCKDALKIIKQVVKMSKDSEVLKHFNAIKKCVKVEN